MEFHNQTMYMDSLCPVMARRLMLLNWVEDLVALANYNGKIACRSRLCMEKVNAILDPFIQNTSGIIHHPRMEGEGQRSTFEVAEFILKT